MSIKGEYSGGSTCVPVWISELASAGCCVLTGEAGTLPDGDATLWIGAVGPLAVRTTRQDESRVHAAFVEPLDSRILEHFAAA